MTVKKVAYVFPGQGSQSAGMGKRLYDTNVAARAVFEEADEALGLSLSKICFESPEADLALTVNAQPAMLVVSIAYLRAIQAEKGSDFVKPSFLAGHSLGHYSALVAEGVLDLPDAVRLVRERGRLMYEAGLAIPGGMLAVIGSDEDTVSKLCSLCGTEIANINCPGQIGVSGSTADLDAFKKQAGEVGIKRVMPLKVSGAFHSRLMQPAADGLRNMISSVNFRDPTVPIVSNVTAQALKSGNDIKNELAEQVLKCVRWQRSVETMLAGGVTDFYEIGQGTVLSGLIKRITTSIEVRHIDDLLWKNN